MDITNPQRAKVLVHALPYIQEYSGKIVVIKYGGNAMISEKLKDSVMRDIVLLSLIGVQVVLVHGGGPEITDMLQKLGKQTQFVDGLRVTDAETADVVQMVLAGKINKTLVNLIGQKGGRAIGLSRRACATSGSATWARSRRSTCAPSSTCSTRATSRSCPPSGATRRGTSTTSTPTPRPRASRVSSARRASSP